MTRVVVDPDLCQGHSMCVLEAPSLFRVPKNGTVEVLLEVLPPELQEAALSAVRHCPSHALSIEETESA